MADMMTDCHALPPEIIEVARRGAKASLECFARMFWPIVNPGVDMVWNWHLKVICDHLEAVSRGDLKTLVICLPPGSCKSTLVNQMWPCWEMLKQPAHRWAFLTNSRENAFKEAGYRRMIMTSDAYLALSPPAHLLKGGKSISRTVNTRNGEFRAFSLLSKITGAHFDRQVIDDPNDAGAVDKEELEKVIKIYDTVLATRLRDGAARVLIQQRLANNDLAGHVMQLGCDAKLIFPAVYDEKNVHSKTPLYANPDPRRSSGELFWPKRFGGDYLRERRKTLGLGAFLAQYQQAPANESGVLFQREWFHLYAPGNEPLGCMEELLMACDTASSLKASADRTVIQVWGRSGSALYLLDQVSGRFTFSEKIEQIKAAFLRWPKCRRLLIEGRNGGIDLVNSLQPILLSISRGLLKWSSQQNKEVRIRSISPIVENGQVFIPQNREGELLLDEAMSFPNGRHDDCIDVMAMVMDFWRMRVVMADAPSHHVVSPGVLRTSPGTLYRTGMDRPARRRISMRG